MDKMQGALPRLLARDAPARRRLESGWLPPLSWALLTTLLAWTDGANRTGSTGAVDFSYPAWLAAIPVGVGSGLCCWMAMRVTIGIRVRGMRLWRLLLAHGSALIVAAMVMALIDGWQDRLLGVASMSPELRLVPEALHYAFRATAASIGGLVRGLRRATEFDRHLHRSVRVANRERVLAELRLLKADVSPRTIAAAVDRILLDLSSAPGRAERALLAVADVLREAVRGTRSHMAPISEEREAIDQFFQDGESRALVQWSIEPGLDEVAVPQFALWLMLITMADVSPAAARVVAVRRSGWLSRQLEVTVVGATPQPRAAEGKTDTDWPALDTLRERLALQFGGRATLNSGRTPAAHWARLTVPLSSDDAAGDGEIEEVAAEATEAPPNPGPRALRRIGRTALLLWLSGAAVLYWWWWARPVTSLTGAIAPGGVGPRWPLAFWRGLPLPVTGLMAWLATRRAPLGIGSLTWRQMCTHAGGLAAVISIALLLRHFEVRLPQHAVGLIPPVDGGARAVVLRVAAVSLLYVLTTVVAHVEVLSERRRASLSLWRALRRRRAVAVSRRSAAELRALKAELNPHFVGNALHVAMGLLRTDAALARTILESVRKLSDRATADVMRHEVGLGDDIAELAPYLAIERARVGPATALELCVEVPEALLRVGIPHAALQTLVENAVRHGLAPTGRGGKVTIRARSRGDGWVVVEVEDDGIGISVHGTDRSSPGLGTGSGTRTLRARLLAQYGTGAELRLDPAAGGGLVARMCLPERLLSSSREGRL